MASSARVKDVMMGVPNLFWEGRPGKNVPQSSMEGDIFL